MSAVHTPVYDALAAQYEAAYKERLPINTAAVNLLDRHLPRKAKVLDVGCGIGQFVELLAERGHDVLGIDCSSGMIDSARRHRRAGRFAVADFTLGDWEGYDAVVAIAFIHLWPKAEVPALLEQMKRAVGPGGLIYTGSTDEDVSREGWEPKSDYEGAPVRFRARYTEDEMLAVLARAQLVPLGVLAKTDTRGKRWRDWVLRVPADG